MRLASLRALTTAAAQSSRTLFCPRTHVWLRRLECGTAAHVGLTERALDDIGDVDAVDNVTSGIQNGSLMRKRLQAPPKGRKNELDAHLLGELPHVPKQSHSLSGGGRHRA